MTKGFGELDIERNVLGLLGRVLVELLSFVEIVRVVQPCGADGPRVACFAVGADGARAVVMVRRSVRQ